MNKLNKIKYLLGILLPMSAFGQIVVSPSMDEALQKARHKSESIKSKQIEVEKLGLQHKDILRKRLPRVDASARYVFTDGHTNTDFATIHTPILGIPIFDGEKISDSQFNLATAQVSASMVLFSGLQIPYGAKALEQKRIGTEYLAQTAWQELISEVMVSFDQIKVLEAVKTLIAESRKRLEVEEKRVERSIKEGFAISLDKDKIKLAQLELDSKELELTANEKLIYQKINYLTGLSDEEISAVSNDFSPYYLVEENADIQQKSEMKALKSFLSAQEFLLKKEKGSYLPQVALVGGVRYLSVFDSKIVSGARTLGINHLQMFPSFYVGVGANWNIFSGFSRDSKVKQAQMDIQATQYKIADTEQKLTLLLSKNKENYHLANEKMNINEQKIKVAENNLNIAIKQFQQGLIDISERLQIENDYHKAVIDKVQGIQQQRQSAIELAKAQGKLEQFLVK